MNDEWIVNVDRDLVDYCLRAENWFFFIPSKLLKYIGYLLTYF